MEGRKTGNPEDANQENWENCSLTGFFFFMGMPVIQDEICQGQRGTIAITEM